MLLGFYTTTMMNRWWSQLSKLPHLADVALSLNGITTPGKLTLIEALELWSTTSLPD